MYVRFEQNGTVTSGFLLDTTILVDLYRGVDDARAFLEGMTDPCVSVVTWMEVVVGAKDQDEERLLRRLLDSYITHGVTAQVVEETVRIRRAKRLKLPDAIIWATARCNDLVLVTRNWRDFPADDDAVLVPYSI